LQRGERPISWLIVADGDAPSQVRQAFSDAGIPVAAPVLQEIGRVGSEMANGAAPWARAIGSLNRAARANGVSFAFAPVDLEHAALTEASNETLEALAEKFGSPQNDLDGILGILGSKAVPQQQDKKKAPWMRGYIGETLPGSEISDDIRIILQRWLEPAMTAYSAKQLLRELRA
jgi:hypothetical protein